MTDRELLELAAKAAGIPLCVWGLDGNENFADLTDPAQHRLWSPLTDDGDALRLAVMTGLLIEIDWTSFTASAVVSDAYAVKEVVHVEKFKVGGLDIYSATRRAIVRAAAEIGKQL